jgi:hypothetical protein
VQQQQKQQRTQSAPAGSSGGSGGSSIDHSEWASERVSEGVRE